LLFLAYLCGLNSATAGSGAAEGQILAYWRNWIKFHKIQLRAIVVFAMGMLTWQTAHAQEVIKGHVSDQAGTDLEGVTVQSKLGHKSVTTNGQGNFEISVSIGDELSFTYVGYKPKKALVSSAHVLNVVMVSDQTSMNDVVVIGYGTQKRRDVTAAVASSGGPACTGDNRTGVTRASRAREACRCGASTTIR